MATHYDDTLLCTKRASRYIGLTARTLEQWRYLGKGPPYRKIGRSIRYVLAELMSWLEAKRVDPAIA